MVLVGGTWGKLSFFPKEDGIAVAGELDKLKAIVEIRAKATTATADLDVIGRGTWELFSFPQLFLG